MRKKCSICGNESEAFMEQSVSWNPYEGATYFADQEHNYTFCESCLHDMVQGNPLKGTLKQFIVGDPSISWTGLNPATLPKKERDKYATLFLKTLKEPFENA